MSIKDIFEKKEGKVSTKAIKDMIFGKSYTYLPVLNTRCVSKEKEIRDKEVLKYFKLGLNKVEISKKVGIDRGTVRSILKRYSCI